MGRTAVPRLLRVLDRVGLRGTFFVPGYTAERWPAVVRSIRDAGHEIAHHGFMHEGSRARGNEVDEATEEARLLRGFEALDAVLGLRPVGYRAPNWEMTYRLPALLARNGFRYDSGLMDSDWPYLLATSAHEGAPTLVELPVHWTFDDWNRYNYLPGLSSTSVIARPSQVADAWAEELRALVVEGGLFNLTNHSFVSGRPARAAALERLMTEARSIDGLWIVTCSELADWVASLPLDPVLHEAPVPERIPAD